MLVESCELVLVFGLRANACFCGGYDGPEQLTLVGLLRDIGYSYHPMFTWAAASLVAAGILLAVWAWFGDQWRRRGRTEYSCPGCNYDLRGVIQGSTFPLTCSECAVAIESRRAMNRPRRAWKLLVLSVLVLVAAHYTARGPEVRNGGWVRLIPSTLLVLQPMDVEAWIDARFGPDIFPAGGTVPEVELARRLSKGGLGAWQEWILFKRVERACHARDDYGITSAQYETARILRTTPANATREETAAERLAGLSIAAGIPFRIDWVSLGTERLRANGVVQPTDPHATIADALDGLCDELWPRYAYWDISPEGVVLSSRQPTVRSRIYDVSGMAIERAGDLGLVDMVAEDGWINHVALTVSDHLVVVAATKTHLKLEQLLIDLRKVIEAEPPFTRPYRVVGDARTFDLESDDYYLGLLDHVRAARSVSIEALRTGAPTLADGVTEDELDACGRAAFGLLDTLRLRRLPGTLQRDDPRSTTNIVKVPLAPINP